MAAQQLTVKNMCSKGRAGMSGEGGRGWSTCLERLDVFQLDGAAVILLAHTHDGRLEDLAGLQNEHLHRGETLLVRVGLVEIERKKEKKKKKSGFQHYLLTHIQQCLSVHNE